MRVRFWRKEERPVFDPEAGEVPEYPEPWAGVPWPSSQQTFRFTGRLLVAGLVAINVVQGCNWLVGTGPHPLKLIVMEDAPLDEVCAEGTHLQTLRAVAPCDPSARSVLALDPSRKYDVVLAAKFGVTDPKYAAPYLLDSACYQRLDAHASVEPCIAANLLP
jgi:hypothetical protein